MAGSPMIDKSLLAELRVATGNAVKSVVAAVSLGSNRPELFTVYLFF